MTHDWRKPEDYERLNYLTLDQWAWEFLKRNPAYIEEWERLTQGWTEEEKEFTNRHLLSGHKWGLQSLLNPDSKYIYVNIRFMPLGGYEAIDIVSGHQKGSMVLGLPDYNTGTARYKFNFNQPIVPQLTLVKKELLKLQRESKLRGNTVRHSFKPRGGWISLIRILDAITAGATYKDIFDVLFPDELTGNDPDHGIKKIYDMKEQAMRYISEEYRLIPYSEK